MNPQINAAIAADRQRDLERAAGCCTAAAEFRRSTPARLSRIAAWHIRRGDVRPVACCA
jgi:hypothetical protein